MPKPKASLKARYATDKLGVVGTLAVDAGDFRLLASATDTTFVGGPSLNGLSLSIEKPGSFFIDYDVPKQDVLFQFMNTVRVLDKPLNLTYTHEKGVNQTALNGTLVLDPANKLSANYGFDSGNCRLKYTYMHGAKTTFEPSYDFAQNSWDFTVLQKLSDDDILRASYETSSKVLGLDWSRNSMLNGTLKISASVNLAEKQKVPKFCAESSWNFDM
ncbi:hypothetical protein RHGRI_023553 [Rhododendron griersonianum]|uniref:Uncharacterized protein n=1 Tax=Rhododendron griersonianum TaxID=479676 RepID=A0AAV6J7X8_9ERIC|nr:hypothetical protein RHGRI_023553 [Rhododendron griersonianum]